MKTIEQLEAEAEEAANRVRLAKAERQAACAHPIAALSFHYDGVSSYHGYKTDHHMYVECSHCYARFRNKLTIHDDP
jgi:hypothetical protein